MSFFGSSSSSDSANITAEPSSTELKNALIQQVQAEAAVTNARALVTVSHHLFSQQVLYIHFPKLMTYVPSKSVENKRKLLRPLRSVPRLVTHIGRIDMPLIVHGEVHFSVEHH